MNSQIFKPQTKILSLCFADPLCFLLIFLAVFVSWKCIWVFCLKLLILDYYRSSFAFELKEKESRESCKLLGFREKTLQYKNIKQVELKQGLIQRALDIGDVVVTTQATAQHADIQLFNLKEYKEVYEFLLAKLNQNDAA